MSEKLLVPDIGDFEEVEVIEILVKKGDQIKIINMDRWPNWIRRSATNREIPDSSSGRSTK